MDLPLADVPSNKTREYSFKFFFQSGNSSRSVLCFSVYCRLRFSSYGIQSKLLLAKSSQQNDLTGFLRNPNVELMWSGRGQRNLPRWSGLKAPAILKLNVLVPPNNKLFNHRIGTISINCRICLSPIKELDESICVEYLIQLSSPRMPFKFPVEFMNCLVCDI